MWKRRPQRIGWLAAGATGILLPLLLRARLVPPGVPGEWTWGLLEHPLDLAVLGPVLAVLPVLGLLWYGGGRLAQGRGRARKLLAGLVGTVGTGVSFAALQVSPPTPYDIARWPNILYWPMSSGYFRVAREKLRGPSWRALLSRYPDFQRAQPDPFHLATHPPGLVVLHGGAIWLCRRYPGLTATLLRTEPELLRLGYRVMPPLPPAERASLTLFAYVTFLLTCVAFWPIWSAVRRRAPGRVAWAIATLWWFTPGIVVFCPKSDVLYPTLAAFIVLGVIRLAEGVEHGGTAWITRGAALGLLLWVGMFLSFAFIAIWGIGLLGAGLFCLRARQGGRARLLGGWLVAAVVFGLATAVFYAITSCNLVESWWVCYTRHAEFNVRFPRSYWRWLLVDPVEFAVSAGTVTTWAALRGVLRSVRKWGRGPAGPRLSALAHDSLVLAWGVLFVVLVLSGKNRGEVARLWLLFVPFLLVAGARAIDGWTGWLRLVLLGAQAASALLLVNTLQGFMDPHSVKLHANSDAQREAVVAGTMRSNCERNTGYAIIRANRRQQWRIELASRETGIYRGETTDEQRWGPSRARRNQSSSSVPRLFHCPGRYRFRVHRSRHDHRRLACAVQPEPDTDRLYSGGRSVPVRHLHHPV